jgi:microcompartment protein CcmL/EutN
MMTKKKQNILENLNPALALVEFSSIAGGILAADAMIKKAPINVIKTGTVQPGKYLVLIGGSVADVEESLAAGEMVGERHLLDTIFLPDVHPEVVESIGGGRVPDANDAVGVIETTTVSAAIHAADAGIKGAYVHLIEVRLADGLGGKGITLFSGLVADVEAAVEIGSEALSDPKLLVETVVIPKLHPEMWANLSDATRFMTRVTGES